MAIFFFIFAMLSHPTNPILSPMTGMLNAAAVQVTVRQMHIIISFPHLHIWLKVDKIRVHNNPRLSTFLNLKLYKHKKIINFSVFYGIYLKGHYHEKKMLRLFL
jgi:hypothetical protein